MNVLLIDLTDLACTGIHVPLRTSQMDATRTSVQTVLVIFFSRARACVLSYVGERVSDEMIDPLSIYLP